MGVKLYTYAETYTNQQNFPSKYPTLGNNIGVQDIALSFDRPRLPSLRHASLQCGGPNILQKIRLT